jgi:cytosine/adenosine deaminase-related metal-dependent hydrolase
VRAVIFRAKYALVGAGEVRTDVRLEVDGNHITDFTSGFYPGPMAADYDFGEAVILPGLVNPHCHLELEFCGGQVPYNGSFTDWLQKIRDLKNGRGGQATTDPRASIQSLLASGCTAVVDHHATDLDWEAVAESGIRYIPMREFFQFDNHAPDAEDMQRRAQRGFAPHAPYTASLEVARACRQLSNRAALPMSVHLSEIPAEIEFIRDGRSADIVQLLKQADSYDASFRGTGKSPIRLYADEGLLDGPTYTIHVNYVDDGDLEILADLKPTVVFCPRSHSFFRHGPHPIARFLAAGIPVALGTDSLASNERLSARQTSSSRLRRAAWRHWVGIAGWVGSNRANWRTSRCSACRAIPVRISPRCWTARFPLVSRR